MEEQYINQANFVSRAESVMGKLEEDGRLLKLTTTKLRNILTLVSEIYNRASRSRDKKLSEGLRSKVQYLKMRIVYESGREVAVKDFVNRAGLLREIDAIGDSRDRLITFCHYMEALVAYRKFMGPDSN